MHGLAEWLDEIDHEDPDALGCLLLTCSTIGCLGLVTGILLWVVGASF